MLSFSLQAKRNNSSGSLVTAKSAELTIDTSLAGRPDTLNPVELLLASQAACFIKGIERLAPTLEFDFRGVQVFLEADRPENEAKIAQIRYRVLIETDESEQRIALMHKNLQKQGTIYNTLSAGTELVGSVTRANVQE
jgi:uncharacterized OsmC-like protein